MRKLLVLCLLVVFSLLIACNKTINIPLQEFCETDKDCVPAQCCHATGAVNKDYAPDCSGMFCTMECAPRTLDCGQGEIKCVESRCSVILYE